jgi:hypothetical protein
MRRMLLMIVLWVFCFTLLEGCSPHETSAERPRTSKRSRVPAPEDVKHR